MHSQESLRLLVQEFISKSDRIREYSQNRQATGLHRERIVESFLRKLSPRLLSIGSGFLMDQGKSSPQVDLLIYDDSHFVPIFDEGGFVIIHPLSVVQIIEVKTSLDKKRLSGALENIYQTKSFNTKIQASIFGFSGKQNVEDVMGDIAEFIQSNANDEDLFDKLPEAIIILDKWVLIKVYKSNEEIDYIYANDSSFEEQFVFYFDMIHHKNYGYMQKLIDGKFPSLNDLGYSLQHILKGVQNLNLKRK